MLASDISPHRAADWCKCSIGYSSCIPICQISVHKLSLKPAAHSFAPLAGYPALASMHHTLEIAACKQSVSIILAVAAYKWSWKHGQAHDRALITRQNIQALMLFKADILIQMHAQL